MKNLTEVNLYKTFQQHGALHRNALRQDIKKKHKAI